MRKKSKVLALVIAVGMIFVFSFLFAILSRSEVETKIKDLEYWQRAHFQQTTGRDWILRRFWTQLFGKRPDAAVEMERCQRELLDLGYLIKHTFPLSAPVTNQADRASFHLALVAAALPDTHWSYSFQSNQLNAVLARDDLKGWQSVVKAWDARRRSAASSANDTNSPIVVPTNP